VFGARQRKVGTLTESPEQHQPTEQEPAEEGRAAEAPGGSGELTSLSAVLAVAGALVASPLLPFAVVPAAVAVARAVLAARATEGLASLPLHQRIVQPLRRSALAVIRVVPSIVPIGCFVAVAWPLDSEVESNAFHNAAASEVIPLLLIGLAIEVGYLRLRERAPVDAVLAVVTVVFLVLAEVDALMALANNTTEHADIVAGGIAAGASALFLAAVQSPRTSPNR